MIFILKNTQKIKYYFSFFYSILILAFLYILYNPAKCVLSDLMWVREYESCFWRGVEIKSQKIRLSSSLNTGYDGPLSGNSDILTIFKILESPRNHSFSPLPLSYLPDSANSQKIGAKLHVQPHHNKSLDADKIDRMEKFFKSQKCRRLGFSIFCWYLQGEYFPMIIYIGW